MFNSITDWIAQNITEPLQELIINVVNAYLITFLNSFVDIITGVMLKELELAKFLIDNPYISQAVKYSIGMALTLLAVRIAFESFQTYIAYSNGEENHPGELLIKAVTATVLIVSVPWITKQILVFSFSIVDDIQGLQAVPDVNAIGQVIFSTIFASGKIVAPVVCLIILALVLWLIILIQMAVRAVNIAMLMIIGPWMWAFKNELGKTWFKAVLGQCFAIPIQIFMLRGALGSLISTSTEGFTATLLFVGFLWATLKFPVFLQQLVEQTGVGGAIGGTAKMASTGVLIRRMAMRG